MVDNFAGGGGASTGIEAAIGRPVDIAINHDADAIRMHTRNHPSTRHYQENIWEVDPKVACGSAPVELLWASPDCTHFSRAKGSAPRAQGIRALAWVVVRWARAVSPRVIALENVEEFQTWGPLDDEGQPDPSKRGETFREWLAQLVALGYAVETRSLVAADYGAPTTRRRLFVVARRDGLPIVWPDQTHGAGRAEPWRPAFSVIDWSLPAPSIFERKRPLKEATLRRIAAGIQRYVVGASQPFVMPLTHHGDKRTHSLEEPLRTVTGAHRGELAIVEPFVVRHGHYSTVTGAGLREGCGAGTFRGQRLSAPLATVCATNDKHLVCPIVTKHYGGVTGHRVDRPLGTVTATDHHALTAAFLTKFYGTSTGADVRSPMPTVTGGAGGGHMAEVRAFLVKYYGAGGKAQQQARFGLVELRGEPYVITDIGMRMLQPHELFAAQGFPSSYAIDADAEGRPFTKTAQTRLAGNSVCPPVAEQLVAANMRQEARAA